MISVRHLQNRQIPDWYNLVNAHPGGNITRRTDSSRDLQIISSGALNTGKVETDGVDLSLRYVLDMSGGSLIFDSRVNYIRQFKVSGDRWVSGEREYVYDDNDWTRWAPEGKVIEVPGDHDSMVLVPNVSVLAAEVKSVLDSADAMAAESFSPDQEAA